MIHHVVILAGGSGTRLWPASRAQSPKQFLALGSGRSLFQQTLQRALGLQPAGRVLVVTHESQAQAVRAQAQAMQAAPGAGGAGQRLAILAEPDARNTAPAIAYACAWLEARGEGDAPLMVLPADHVIEPQERFAAAARESAALASGGRLVVFGVRPTRPETGYGYIEAGDKLDRGFLVRSFHEKPDEETARRYLKSGGFYWNSGMFTFTARSFLDQAIALATDLAFPFAQARAELALLEPDNGVVPAGEALRALYRGLKAISIDFAIMEKSRKVAMVVADFEWSDVGSWDEVARVGRPRGELASVQGEDNFVLSDIPVALAGVSGLIVVIRDGVALVCRKGSSQLVRDVVEGVKASGRSDLL